MSASIHLSKIKERIQEFHELFGQVEDDYEDFDDEITKIPNMEPAEYFDFLERRRVTPYGKLYSDFHDFIVTEVFNAYMEGGAEERQAIIEQLDRCFYTQSKVWGLMSDYRWKLQHSKQDERPGVLRRLLLFAILEEESLDHFETGNILRGAWYEAEHNGMNPDQFFREAAAIAGKRKIVFGRSASEILEAFDPRQ